MDLLNEFSDMVMRLKKPGEVILAQMTPEKMDLLHMAIGVAGELVELDKAVVNEDVPNILEEVGDVEFYMEGVRQNTGIERTNVFQGLHDEDEDCVLDVVKKYCVYNKTLNLAKLHDAMVRIDHSLINIRHTYGITREECLEHNMQKLEKGEKSRYKGGYSDAAAQARADKQ